MKSLALLLFRCALGPRNERLAHLQALLDGARDAMTLSFAPRGHTSESWANVLREVRLLGEFLEAAEAKL